MASNRNRFEVRKTIPNPAEPNIGILQAPFRAGSEAIDTAQSALGKTANIIDYFIDRDEQLQRAAERAIVESVRARAIDEWTNANIDNVRSGNIEAIKQGLIERKYEQIVQMSIAESGLRERTKQLASRDIEESIAAGTVRLLNEAREQAYRLSEIDLNNKIANSLEILASERTGFEGTAIAINKSIHDEIDKTPFPDAIKASEKESASIQIYKEGVSSLFARTEEILTNGGNALGFLRAKGAEYRRAVEKIAPNMLNDYDILLNNKLQELEGRQRMAGLSKSESVLRQYRSEINQAIKRGDVDSFRALFEKGRKLAEQIPEHPVSYYFLDDDGFAANESAVLKRRKMLDAVVGSRTTAVAVPNDRSALEALDNDYVSQTRSMGFDEKLRVTALRIFNSGQITDSMASTIKDGILAASNNGEAGVRVAAMLTELATSSLPAFSETLKNDASIGAFVAEYSRLVRNNTPPQQAAVTAAKMALSDVDIETVKSRKSDLKRTEVAGKINKLLNKRFIGELEKVVGENIDDFIKHSRNIGSVQHRTYASMLAQARNIVENHFVYSPRLKEGVFGGVKQETLDDTIKKGIEIAAMQIAGSVTYNKWKMNFVRDSPMNTHGSQGALKVRNEIVNELVKRGAANDSKTRAIVDNAEWFGSRDTGWMMIYRGQLITDEDGNPFIYRPSAKAFR